MVGGALRRAARIRRLESALAGTRTSEAAGTALATGWVDDLADGLLADSSTPPDYVRAMLPRFVAATVGDAVRETG